MSFFLGAESIWVDDHWLIIGKIEEDRYKWVSDFEATHPKYGWVKGSYETALEAKSKKALKHFMDNHPPELWDSKDI